MSAPAVLLVEDDENDAFFFEHAFRAAAVSARLVVARNGDEAIRTLEREAEPPCLVVLDINLPVKNGLEVLRWIREQARFDTLPVVMFTSSAADRDQREAFHLRANSFVLKPGNLKELTRVVARLLDYWLAVHHPPCAEEEPAPA